MKTIQGWHDSQNQLTPYLDTGDEVEPAFADWALNIMPPAYWSDRIVQIGEPHSHVHGQPTYATFYLDAGVWRFGGHCYRGRVVPPQGM